MSSFNVAILISLILYDGIAVNIMPCFIFLFSALIKQVNKSIDGTADDEDEGVPTDQAIRAGLELLKASILLLVSEHVKLSEGTLLKQMFNPHAGYLEKYWVDFYSLCSSYMSLPLLKFSEYLN